MKSTRKQKGGFNFGALASLATKSIKAAAASPMAESLGKELANQGKQIAKDIVHDHINKAADKLAAETGIKIDTTHIKNSVTKHIGAGHKKRSAKKRSTKKRSTKKRSTKKRSTRKYSKKRSTKK